jgi:hypothetical protein
MWRPFKKNLPRDMGYVTDQKGIMRRYRRERANWQEHLDNTKKFITENTPTGINGSIAVMGSGYLLDLPLGYLLQAAQEVYLYDIVHPAEVKKMAMAQPKLVLVEKDITGMAEKLRHARSAAHIEKILQQPAHEWAVAQHDCCISLNILNQLDILLIDYAHTVAIIPESLEKIARETIQANHLSSLRAGINILVTDTKETRIAASGKSMEINNLHVELSSLSDIRKRSQWKWKFDTAGLYIQDSSVIFDVEALVMGPQKKQLCAV